MMAAIKRLNGLARFIASALRTTDEARQDGPVAATPKPFLEYAPAGWETLQSLSNKDGWNLNHIVEIEKAKWPLFRKNLQGTGPLGFSHEHPDLSMTGNVAFHNLHLTYAYVLALTAQGRNEISVLDWGGALGHYYLIAKAVLPVTAVDFHCKEVPLMAEAGHVLNPDVHWHTDDRCLARTYDLVVVSGSLQYDKEWRSTLLQLAQTAGRYLLLTHLPVVADGPGFVAIQRVYDTELLHQQFNEAEVLQAVANTGLRLVRELVIGDRPHIENAPQQCELRGWIFERTT